MSRRKSDHIKDRVLLVVSGAAIGVSVYAAVTVHKAFAVADAIATEMAERASERRKMRSLGPEIPQ